MPDVTSCKPMLAIYDVKLSSSLLGIVVVADSNVASTQPDLSTRIWLISGSVVTYSILHHNQEVPVPNHTGKSY